MWIAKKLELPIRIESADKSFSQDYDIKEGQVDDALFEMPAGYQKMTMPAGMPDEVMEFGEERLMAPRKQENHYARTRLGPAGRGNADQEQ